MQEKVEQIIQKRIQEKHLSGAILQVNLNGKVHLEGAYGIHSFADQIEVGGLVEVVTILPMLLKLVERRRSRLALNHKLSLYFPEFKHKNKENLQIMNLLTHTSGLDLEDFTQDLIFQPGSKVQYNPQNFQILPALFEIVSGYAFHHFYKERFLDLMVMEDTTLTEDYQLTTTISDLSRYAEMIEKEGTYDFIRIINKKAVQLSKQNFTSFLTENRGLGWSLHTSEEPLYQGYSKHTYGYLDGLTTSLLVDPKRSLTLLLHLTPFTEGVEEKVLEIRREIHQVFAKEV